MYCTRRITWVSANNSFMFERRWTCAAFRIHQRKFLANLRRACTRQLQNRRAISSFRGVFDRSEARTRWLTIPRPIHRAGQRMNYIKGWNLSLINLSRRRAWCVFGQTSAPLNLHYRNAIIARLIPFPRWWNEFHAAINRATLQQRLFR